MVNTLSEYSQKEGLSTVRAEIFDKQYPTWDIERGRALVIAELQAYLDHSESQIEPSMSRQLWYPPVKKDGGKYFVKIPYGGSKLNVVVPVVCDTEEQANNYIKVALTSTKNGELDTEITQCHAKLSEESKVRRDFGGNRSSSVEDFNAEAKEVMSPKKQSSKTQ
jgi:hypothetical protein